MALSDALMNASFRESQEKEFLEGLDLKIGIISYAGSQSEELGTLMPAEDKKEMRGIVAQFKKMFREIGFPS